VFTVIKKKALKEILWIIPILIFLPMSFTASRNVFLGYITLTFALAWVLSFIHDPFKLKLAPRTILFIILILFYIGHIYFLGYKRAPIRFITLSKLLNL